jgi:hypothetical protein
MLHKIYGLNYEEVYCDDLLLWICYIDKPFFFKDGLRIGINEKFLETAIKNGVNKIIAMVGGDKEVVIGTPTIKMLKEKRKLGEYQMQDSIFEWSNPYRIYYFKI